MWRGVGRGVGGASGVDPNTCDNGLATCRDDLATCDIDLVGASSDLNACNSDLMISVSDLSVCNSDLTTSVSDLSACNSDLTSCTSGADLTTCNGNLTTCSTDLSASASDLSACDSELTTCNDELVIFDEIYGWLYDMLSADFVIQPSSSGSHEAQACAAAKAVSNLCVYYSGGLPSSPGCFPYESANVCFFTPRNYYQPEDLCYGPLEQDLFSSTNIGGSASYSCPKGRALCVYIAGGQA